MSYNLWVSLAVLLGYLVLKHVIFKVVRKIGSERGVAYRRIKYVASSLSLVLFVIALSTITILLGIDYHEVGLIFSSLFAILGVALFAQWSILSNVTASIIIFFLFPYRVGDHVVVLDAENTIEGVIEEINLFHILLIDQNKDVVTIPNSMTFQKSVRIVDFKRRKAED